MRAGEVRARAACRRRARTREPIAIISGSRRTCVSRLHQLLWSAPPCLVSCTTTILVVSITRERETRKRGGGWHAPLLQPIRFAGQSSQMSCVSENQEKLQNCSTNDRVHFFQDISGKLLKRCTQITIKLLVSSLVSFSSRLHLLLIKETMLATVWCN